jgi:biopolymer transport protein ExbB
MEFYWDTAEYLRQGGWIMAPLVAVSVIMWTLIVDRWRGYRELEGDRLPALLVDEFRLEASGHPELDVEILRQCSLRLRRDLDNRLAVIAVLAAVAPLLGLLGTVLGMIETFDVIARFGTGNARAMAGGISVALITTQTGLLVAIPGLVMSNRLGSKAALLGTTLEEATTKLARNLAAGGAEKGQI